MKAIKAYKVLKSICVIMTTISCLAGCSSQSDRDFQSFQKNAKETVDPLKLQEWFLFVSTNRENYKIQEQNVPFWIKKIDLGAHAPPTAIVCVRTSETEKTVCISWGGGFEQWGFIVGDKNFKIQDHYSSMRYVLWVPGVYFFKN